MTASVIICTYSQQRWPILGRAVAALKEQSVPPREIIVVVDNNHDLLAQARADLDVTAVVPNRHPGGASGGRLTGSEQATSPIIVFLDDDAIAEPQWLEKLLEQLEDRTAIGVGGPR